MRYTPARKEKKKKKEKKEAMAKKGDQGVFFFCYVPDTFCCIIWNKTFGSIGFAM